MTDYQKQAADFLSAHSLTFRAVYVGEDCPTFCEDAAKGDALVVGTFPCKNHIHGSHWRLTLSGEKRGHFTVDYWDSYNDAKNRHDHKKAAKFWEAPRDRAKRIGAKPASPTPYDMLACIEKNDPGTFEDFCGDFGYDTDSRRAETVYQAVVKQYRQLARFLTPEELTEAQEIN